jgi:hypothetical protein
MLAHDEHIKQWTQEKYRIASVALDEPVSRPPAMMKEGVYYDLMDFWIERARVRALLWSRMRAQNYDVYMANLKIAESLEYRQGEHGLLDRLAMSHFQRIWFTENNPNDMMEKMRVIQ